MLSHTSDRDVIITFLRKNKNLLEHEYGVKKIALFGSYARGEQSERSDIDLIIDTNNSSFKNRCRLKHFLEDHLGKPVDLCYFNGLRLFIKSEIEKDLVCA